MVLYEEGVEDQGGICNISGKSERKVLDEWKERRENVGYKLLGVK